MTDSCIISKGTQQRLISDIKDIIKNPLIGDGIYYAHDETKILAGYAMIVGPPDTLYEDGVFFFEFLFPPDYPYSPPKLTFKTYDGKTRFHPNLYRNGKVCLSILNTWRGEQWTSCQTIRSILLTLVTLFHNEPLLNEPGVTKMHRDFNAYNDIIKYRNYEVAIYQMITYEKIPPLFSSFYIYVKKHFIEKYDKIMERLEKESKKDIKNVRTSLYSMTCKTDYCLLYKLMNEISKKILKLN
jgi:ubiquitin-protein ligase